MTNIIAAHFDDFEHADKTVTQLSESGAFASTDIDRIVLGAPGRHGQFPVGGDEYADAGATHGDEGAIAGAAIGGAVGALAGLAGAAVLGPIAPVAGAALGAYSGSFAGAIGRMGGTPPAGAEHVEAPRGASVMVMVHAVTDDQRELALRIFKDGQAVAIESSDGEWNHGTWADFNPVAPPHWVSPPHAVSTPAAGAAHDLRHQDH